MADCKEKALTFVPETVSKLQLNDILGKFYAEARRADGKINKKTSLFTLKFAIQRKMKAKQFVDTIILLISSVMAPGKTIICN